MLSRNRNKIVLAAVLLATVSLVSCNFSTMEDPGVNSVSYVDPNSGYVPTSYEFSSIEESEESHGSGEVSSSVDCVTSFNVTVDDDMYLGSLQYFNVSILPKTVSRVYYCFFTGGEEDGLTIDTTENSIVANKEGVYHLIFSTKALDSEGEPLVYEMDLEVIDNTTYITSFKVDLEATGCNLGESINYTTSFLPESLDDKDYDVTETMGAGAHLLIEKTATGGTITADAVGSYTLKFTSHAMTDRGAHANCLRTINIVEVDEEVPEDDGSTNIDIDVPDFDDAIIFTATNNQVPASDVATTFDCITTNNSDVCTVEYAGISECPEGEANPGWRVIESGGYFLNQVPLHDFQTFYLYTVPNADNLAYHALEPTISGLTFKCRDTVCDPADDDVANYMIMETYPINPFICGPDFTDLAELPDYFMIENNTPYPIEIYVMGTLTSQI